MGEKEESVTTAVFKFDMHCAGCAKKITKHIRKIQGVESVKADSSTGTLVVTGKIDPLKIKEKVEEKTKRTIELVPQQPTKPAKEADNGGGDEKKSDDKKPEEKKSEVKTDDKKPEEKKSEVKSGDNKPVEKKKKEKEKPNEPPIATVQFKTRVHCDGCKDKIIKIVSKYPGVQDVNVDLQKDLITAKGTMNVSKLLPYLNLKLKRAVELVPTKKDDEAGGDKKPKESAVAPEKPKEAPEKTKDAGGDKSEKPKESGDAKKESGGEASSSKDNTSRMEVNKMEYYPTSYYNRYAQVYEPQPQGNGYGYQVTDYWQQPPEYSQAPQMFSDENPNACSVM